MLRNKPFIFSCVVLVILALFDLLAIHFDWYVIFWWFDIPMHILGGLWAGLLASSYLFSPQNVLFPHAQTFHSLYKPIFCIVLLIGVGWEVFEILGGIMHFSDSGYVFDTIKDLVDDTAGGLLGAFIAYRTLFVALMPVQEVVVERVTF